PHCAAGLLNVGIGVSVWPCSNGARGCLMDNYTRLSDEESLDVPSMIALMAFVGLWGFVTSAAVLDLVSFGLLARVPQEELDMRAKDVMTEVVLTIAPDKTIYEAAERLVAARVSAMPVVDQHGRMVGIVSEADLIGQAGALDEPRDPFLRRASENVAAAAA